MAMPSRMKCKTGTNNCITYLIKQITCMASSYVQQYPVPPQFAQILKNFAKEVLREQPSNVIEYSARYFEALEKGSTLHSHSKTNIPASQRKYVLSHDHKKAEQLRRVPQSGLTRESFESAFAMVADKYDEDKSGFIEYHRVKNLIDELSSELQQREVTELELSQRFRDIEKGGINRITQKELMECSAQLFGV